MLIILSSTFWIIKVTRCLKHLHYLITHCSLISFDEFKRKPLRHQDVFFFHLSTWFFFCLCVPWASRWPLLRLAWTWCAPGCWRRTEGLPGCRESLRTERLSNSPSVLWRNGQAVGSLRQASIYAYCCVYLSGLSQRGETDDARKRRKKQKWWRQKWDREDKWQKERNKKKDKEEERAM